MDKAHEEPPPPYHDWTVIPDTALLPPPPGMSYKYSTKSNATYAIESCSASFSYRIDLTLLPDMMMQLVLMPGQTQIHSGQRGNSTKPNMLHFLLDSPH